MNALEVWSHDSTFKLNMMMSHSRQLRATGLRYPFERLFDPVWYVETYPDVAGFRDGPLNHYLLHGEAKGYRPNPLFDPVWYVETYPDVAGFRDGPLNHYLLHGEAEGRPPTRCSIPSGMSRPTLMLPGFATGRSAITFFMAKLRVAAPTRCSIPSGMSKPTPIAALVPDMLWPTIFEPRSWRL